MVPSIFKVYLQVTGKGVEFRIFLSVADLVIASHKMPMPIPMPMMIMMIMKKKKRKRIWLYMTFD